MTALQVMTSVLIALASGSAASAEGQPEKTRGVVVVSMRSGAILGGFQGGRFVGPAAAAADYRESEAHRVFGPGLGGSERRLTLGPVTHDERCDWYPLSEDPEVATGVALSPNADWDPAPRKPESLSPQSGAYRQIVRTFLRDKGIREPVVDIQWIVRVDLEGDGQDEVLIHAAHDASRDLSQEEAEALDWASLQEIQAGTHSFVMLRKIVAGEVANILIDGEFWTADEKGMQFALPRHELCAILDLDGDGRMEIVTHSSYYESDRSRAHAIREGEAVEIMSTGCGA